MAAAKIRAGLGIAAFPFDAPRDLFAFAERCEAVGRGLALADGSAARRRRPARGARHDGDAGRLYGAHQVRHERGGGVAARSAACSRSSARRSTSCRAAGCCPCSAWAPTADPVWKATGRDPAERGRRADEALEIAQRLWRGEEVHFAGRFHRYAGRAHRAAARAAAAAVLDRRQQPGGDPPHRAARHGLARRARAARRGRARDRRDPGGARDERPHDRPRPLRRDAPLPHRRARRLARRALRARGGERRSDGRARSGSWRGRGSTSRPAPRSWC